MMQPYTEAFPRPNQNPWQLYDDLIAELPESIRVKSCNAGYNWTSVISDENSIGLAMTIALSSMPPIHRGSIAGMSLKNLAELSKSWNFVEAALGVAALGAYYNHPDRFQNCGLAHRDSPGGNCDAFDLYRKEINGKRVALIGHFPLLEKRLASICHMTILERQPQAGDMPDTACEYILEEQDYLFITGCTLVNKSLPRLLQLARNARIILVGPSTPLSPVLFKYGVYGLSGFIAADAGHCEAVIREGRTMALFETGEMVNRVRPELF